MDRFFRQQIRKRWLFSPWLLWECIQIEFFFRHKSGGEISVISAIIFVFVRSKIVYQIKRCLYIFFFSFRLYSKLLHYDFRMLSLLFLFFFSWCRACSFTAKNFNFEGQILASIHLNTHKSPQPCNHAIHT